MRTQRIARTLSITIVSVCIGCATTDNRSRQSTSSGAKTDQADGTGSRETRTTPQSNVQAPDVDDPAGRILRDLGYHSLLTVRVSSVRRSFVLDKITLDLFRTDRARIDNRPGDIGETDCMLEIYNKAKVRVHSFPLKFGTILFWDDFARGRGGAQAATLPSQECSFKYDADLELLVIRGATGRELQRVLLADLLGPGDIRKYREQYVKRVVRYVGPSNIHWDGEYFEGLLQYDPYKKSVEVLRRIALSDFTALSSEFKPLWSSIRAGTTSLLFSVTEIKDFSSLIDKLKKHSDDVSKYLFKRFSTDSPGLLSAPEPSIDMTLGELNRIITEPPHLLFEASKTQSQAAKDLLAKNPSDIRLNRILLEDAYPVEIAKRNSSSYYWDTHPDVLRAVIIWAVNLAESMQRRETELAEFTVFETK